MRQADEPTRRLGYKGGMATPANETMRPEPGDPPGPTGHVYFDATLTPHRSLSRTGFFALMAVIMAIAFAAGMFYFTLGAWPIPGFLGLDVLLIWIAFRLSYRQARLSERVRVTADRLDVARRTPSGRVRHWSLSPQWANVRIGDSPREENEVHVTSRGETLVLGAFLTPDERLDFARALRRALEDARAERWPQEAT
ncbi:MAG: DUF2244 domain-containing protein [Caulobacterales bacterium]|nr:DUF2244 domain-containing protein [Caulobacterales bacterium]